MKIVFFAHPDFLGNKSMDRFAKLLSEGMRKRGHVVEVWSPKPLAFKLSPNTFLSKWLSYIDLYILFPQKVKRLLRAESKDTLYAFTDQSLGIWVPLTAGRHTVIHCHDFLALRSALGEIEENPTKRSGKIYQRLILKGFSEGENFISVSNKTKEDLHKYVLKSPKLSGVVYNGLHQRFNRRDPGIARTAFGNYAGIDLRNGYLLHVGGNQWYKNRIGVVELYEGWRKITSTPLPMLLVGMPVSADVAEKIKNTPYSKDIHCLTNVTDDLLGVAYAGASLFLFPSLGEGFGWPIAEAMASGTLVLTTNEAPMSEVAGSAGYLVPKRPAKPSQLTGWVQTVADTIEQAITMNPEERAIAIERGLNNSKRFDTDISLDQIEAFYYKVVQSDKGVVELTQKGISDRVSSTIN